MCCVMPPASVSTTLAFRIASSSVVLPWSTCHDRHDRRARDEIRVVLERLRLDSLVGVLDRHLALELGGEQLDLFVGQRLGGGLHRPQPIRILMMSRIPTPSAWEKSRTMPDSGLTGPVGWTASRGCFGAPRRAGRGLGGRRGEGEPRRCRSRHGAGGRSRRPDAV
jgi:hypothetical protein